MPIIIIAKHANDITKIDKIGTTQKNKLIFKLSFNRAVIPILAGNNKIGSYNTQYGKKEHDICLSVGAILTLFAIVNKQVCDCYIRCFFFISDLSWHDA
jgi:hypothetical protein